MQTNEEIITLITKLYNNLEDKGYNVHTEFGYNAYHNEDEDGKQDESYTQFQFIEKSSWVDGVRSIILLHKESNKHFRLNEYRSGSAKHEYYYDDPSVGEVTPVQVIRTEYVDVPQQNKET